MQQDTTSKFNLRGALTSVIRRINMRQLHLYSGINDVLVDFFSEILPPEVTHAILSYLAPIDIVNASVVSKTFAGLLDTRGIWKRIVNEQFGPLDEEIFKGNNINWKKNVSSIIE